MRRELLEDWEPKVPRERPTLVVLTEQEGDAALSFRNLARVAVLTPQDVGISDLLQAATLLVSQPSIEGLVSRTGPTRRGAEAKAG